jgi:hypothetical protein
VQVVWCVVCRGRLRSRCFLKPAAVYRAHGGPLKEKRQWHGHTQCLQILAFLERKFFQRVHAKQGQQIGLKPRNKVMREPRRVQKAYPKGGAPKVGNQVKQVSVVEACRG